MGVRMRAMVMLGVALTLGTTGALGATGAVLSAGRAAARVSGAGHLVSWPVTPAAPIPAAPIPAAPIPADPIVAAPADPAQITVPNAALFGWALLDAGTGAITGSANLATVHNTVESMIKPWIAADYLRRLAEDGRTPTKTALAELTLMIVDSNELLAEKYYRLGGADAVTERLIRTCGLTDVAITPYWWSFTSMTPQDAVRYGECVADGRAAGPQWTSFVLDAMRNVRGGVADQVSDEIEGGRWGIIDGLPADIAAVTAIKNGWTDHDDGWHIDCLAINPHWTMVVMLRVSTLQRGADYCASVAAQLVTDP
jgi:hypothetical protein